MKITAVFEPWVIGDGSYPPLTVGMLVNLSFEMALHEVETAIGEEWNAPIRDGEYSFIATVLATYNDSDPISALEANGLRFFIEGPKAQPFTTGQRLKGRGTLVVDYYAWVEYVHEKANAPDIFYNLVVRRIRRVAIPEALIQRHSTGKSLPARVAPFDFGEVTELHTMVGQSFDEEFYLLDLETIEQEVARTFLG